MNYSDRQKKLIKFLTSEQLDAFLIRKKENIAYLTGARGDDSVLFISPRKNILITDSRYEEEYKKSAVKCSIVVAKNKGMGQVMADLCAETNSKYIGFEADHFSYQGYMSAKKSLASRKLIPLTNAVENIRMIKDTSEIQDIRQACKDGSRLMNHAVKIIKPGLSENNVRCKVEAYALKNNLELGGFDIIVASGKNSSMPHASASDKVINQGEMVIIDLGAMYFGYNSDLTRTVFLGTISHKYLQIYTIVLASQSIAIENLKPGVYAKDIDAVSRQYISDKGMGSYFLHSLGHGIGRETHEIPAISQTSKIRLAKGMVITIEPGIYIPGWGGVRIEDTVLITQNGCEILTKGAVKYASRN